MILTQFLKKSPLFILLFMSSAAFAQMKGGAKQTLLWAGPKAGVNVSNFYADSAHSYNQYRVGFTGGAAVNFSFNPVISVQTEVNYSPKGGTYRFHTDTSSIRASYFLTYIDVPLLVQFKGGEQDNAVFFQIGGQQSFLSKASYSEERTYGAVTATLSNSDRDSLGVPKSDFSVIAGFGMISTRGWCFTLRANMGVGDVQDRYNKILIHNMVFQATLGYYFGRKYDVIGGKGRR